jgi:vesicle-associated membrane protein 72
VFLVVADEAAGRSVPFVFLERVKEDFMQRYGPVIDNQSQHPPADEDDFLLEDPFGVAYSLDREFGYQKDTTPNANWDRCLSSVVTI